MRYEVSAIKNHPWVVAHTQSDSNKENEPEEANSARKQGGTATQSSLGALIPGKSQLVDNVRTTLSTTKDSTSYSDTLSTGDVSDNAVQDSESAHTCADNTLVMDDGASVAPCSLATNVVNPDTTLVEGSKGVDEGLRLEAVC